MVTKWDRLHTLDKDDLVDIRFRLDRLLKVADHIIARRLGFPSITYIKHIDGLNHSHISRNAFGKGKITF